MDTSQSTLVQLQLAISLIRDKADYLTAVAIAPHLVLTESDPVRFLRFTGGNPAAAAQSLVRYWQRRVEVFGRERAFLPLSLTGQGALTLEDVEHIKTGMCVLLPQDARGLPVVCYDNSRRLDDSAGVRMRAAFFYGQMVSDYPLSQTEGYIAIILMSLPTSYDSVMQKAQSLIFNTFPARTKAWHMLNCTPEWNQNWMMQGFVHGMMKLFGHLFRQHQTYIHSSQDKREVLRSLQAHGLTREMLPQCIGGLWSYEQVSVWIEERIRRERTPAGTMKTPRSTTAASLAVQHESTSPNQMQIQNREHEEESPQSNQFWVSSLRLLEQARQRVSVSAAYNEALQKPELWQEDCRVDRFLRTEYFHAKYALLRLSRYWELRACSFGAKRHDIMNQTGEAALRRKDLAALETGFLKLLPNDVEGCSVLCIEDISPEGISKDSRERCLFYMCSVLTENPKSQAEGSVLLVNLSSSDGVFETAAYLKRIEHAFPLRFKTVHLISHAPVSRQIELQFDVGEHTLVHVADTKEALLHRLSIYGLSKSGLPKCANGSWGYEMFVHWQDLRTRSEWQIPLGRSWKENTTVGYPAVRESAVLLEESPERRRRLDVMHSRRKRGRVRVEALLLKEQCNELRGEQQQLLQENERLEELIRQAYTTAAIEED